MLVSEISVLKNSLSLTRSKENVVKSYNNDAFGQRFEQKGKTVQESGLSVLMRKILNNVNNNQKSNIIDCIV